MTVVKAGPLWPWIRLAKTEEWLWVPPGAGGGVESVPDSHVGLVAVLRSQGRPRQRTTGTPLFLSCPSATLKNFAVFLLRVCISGSLRTARREAGEQKWLLCPLEALAAQLCPAEEDEGSQTHKPSLPWQRMSLKEEGGVWSCLLWLALTLPPWKPAM